MKRILLYLFALSSLAAQTTPQNETPAPILPATDTKMYWRYYHLAAVGYRRDRQQFHESNSTLRISDRNTLELILRSHLELSHFVAYIQGSCGWLVNGNFGYSSRGAIVGEPITLGKYELGAGYTADAIAAIGLNFKVIDTKNFDVSIIPFGGYKYSHLMNFPEGEDRFTVPNPPVLLPPGNSGFALGRFPNPNQQDWFGFFAEGRLRFLFGSSLEWDLFYQYHRPTMRSKLNEEVDLYLFNPPGTAAAIDLFRGSSVYKVRAATKQVGGTNIRYHGKSGYNFGLHFEGSSAYAHKARYISKRRREQFVLPPIGTTISAIDRAATVHWVSYEVSAYLGYEF